MAQKKCFQIFQMIKNIRIYGVYIIVGQTKPFQILQRFIDVWIVETFKHLFL